MKKNWGDEKIEIYREWFIENSDRFISDLELYKARLFTKFGIDQGLERVDYKNSGNTLKI